jgi:hypothetical protein
LIWLDFKPWLIYLTGDMTTDLHKLLCDRLQQQGVNVNEVPALLRNLSKIFESNPGIDLATINSKLQLLGWNSVTLDYQSLQLALAWMESEKSGHLKDR